MIAPVPHEFLTKNAPFPVTFVPLLHESLAGITFELYPEFLQYILIETSQRRKKFLWILSEKCV